MSQILRDVPAFCVPEEAKYHGDVMLCVDNPEHIGELLMDVYVKWLAECNGRFPVSGVKSFNVIIGRFTGGFLDDEDGATDDDMWCGTFTYNGVAYPVKDNIVAYPDDVR